MSGRLSLGVIGHVDHGKTSLVKALTGIDTDRLKEEKARGMSIVLGFAHLACSAGIVDLIDVPGHEGFVRTMIAGATGIDAALLVVDAREGVKPQTIEHLLVTALIGVRRGAIALTKCELLQAPERAAAMRHLQGLLRGSYLDSAPAVFTSAVSGEGIAELRQVLVSLLREDADADGSGRFYLPVDRVFSVAGRGTVVTGTLRGGRLRRGDEVELMPSGLRSSVRQIECHNREVAEVLPGRRVGINLRHLHPADIVRGEALAPPGVLRAASMLDVQVEVPKRCTQALRDGQPVRLLFGTADVAARLRLLSQAQLEPGSSGLAQLRTQRPVAVPAGDPFVLRSDTPALTIGGGRFLDPVARRHRRGDPLALERLQVLAHGGRGQVLTERLKAAGYAGTTPQALANAAGIPLAQLQAALPQHAVCAVGDALLLYKPFVDALGDMVVAALVRFHQREPARAGAPLSLCRGALPRSAGEQVFRYVMQRLCAGKRIALRDGITCIYGHDPLAALNDAQRQRTSAIEEQVLQGGLAPPDCDELLQNEDGSALLHLLVERGRLLLLPGEQPGRKLVFHRAAVDEATRRMRSAFPPPAQFTVSEARALLGSTRKFMVPLLEYLDAAGVTRRRGDKRTLVGDAAIRR